MISALFRYKVVISSYDMVPRYVVDMSTGYVIFKFSFSERYYDYNVGEHWYINSADLHDNPFIIKQYKEITDLIVDYPEIII